MAITVHTPEVKLSGITSVERMCSNCNKSWTERIEIEGSAKGDGSWFGPNEKEAKKVKEKAYQNYQDAEKREKKQADRQVLCPSCEHFSTKAMAKHFPNGYLAGLKSKYLKALLFALLFMPIFGGIAGFLGRQILSASSKDWKQAWFLIILFAALTLLLVFGFIVNLINAFRVLVGYHRVRKYLQAERDDELLNLAVSCYKKNKDSLDGFMCWARMMLERSKSSDKI
ncbi:hypothetical protein ACFLRX_03580 [Acidobacteriota bacterium]